MKKQVAILLLFCYTFVLMRALLPGISDILAHTFWESEHLATVHFEDGKYHVHLEIQKAEKDNPVKSESAKQTETFSSDYFPPSENANAVIAEFTKLNFQEKELFRSSCFIPVTSPPPWHS